ncbi:MAG: thermonuclease family protein [Candidatus Eisenbacteria bacterium]|uniref:Thermonuclease family protein n=1 Tax=Eiseniibacteriota bacterium TaxID=2212470 RepID=A0A933W0J2_UNCEI|nr:thermonuclease family protein [Candidatus Eisenbacteria bacterium]
MRRLAAALLALALLGGCDAGPERRAPVARRERAPRHSGAPDTALARAGLRRCERVIDGDTVVLDGGERVRLLGVDTPEVHHPKKPEQYFGRRASAYTESRLEGRAVRLEYDRRRTDRYGRTLAYVYLGDTLFNRELVANGYAEVYRDDRYRTKQEFLALEREARRALAGMWAHPESVGVAVAR